MGVLQDAPPRLQVPAGQNAIAHIHKAVQMEEARHKPRRRRAQRRAQRVGQIPRQPRAQRPYRAHYDAYQRQAGQHFPPRRLAPYFLRAGDGQKHPPRHEKAVYPVTHGAAPPSTHGAAPWSSRTPHRIPPPVSGRCAPARRHTPPSTGRSPRRLRKCRRTRTQSWPDGG